MVDFHRQNLNNRPADASGGAPLLAVCRRARWIMLVISAALAYGWIQGESLQVSYRTAHLQTENDKLRALVSALRVEHSALTAPGLIDQQARGGGFIRLDEGIEVIEGLQPLSGPGRMLMAENRKSK